MKAAAASSDAAAVLPSDVSITFSDSNCILTLDVLPGGSNDDVEEAAEDAETLEREKNLASSTC